VEPTVLSGIVSLKRRRSAMASGRVSAIRAETCVNCGHTELFAEKPERLFSDHHRERDS
jgi:hypothetical protein